MRFKTVIESRIPKEKPRNKWLFAFMMVIEIVLNTFIPFVVGFHFAQTKSFLFLAIFILLILFNVRFEYKKDNIQLKIIRGI